jgi:hypothetical protein
MQDGHRTARSLPFPFAFIDAKGRELDWTEVRRFHPKVSDETRPLRILVTIAAAAIHGFQ